MAGTRGCVESGFEATLQQMGLNAYEMCSALCRDRHMTMALQAMLLAAKLPAETHLNQQREDSRTAVTRSRELVAPT